MVIDEDFFKPCLNIISFQDIFFYESEYFIIVYQEQVVSVTPVIFSPLRIECSIFVYL